MKDITPQEKLDRFNLAETARQTILHTLPIEDEEENCLMMGYEGFYLQIIFSQLHPLMLITFIRKMEYVPGPQHDRMVNELNIKHIHGCHIISKEAGCYTYRAAHWLDTEVTKARFLEKLSRCHEEVVYGFSQLNRPL